MRKGSELYNSQLMNMNVSVDIIDHLFDLAQQTPKTAAARIAAAVVYKKKIVSIGFNSLKTHPFQAKHSSNEKAICLHAENDAIIRALKKLTLNELEKASMYVVRAKQPKANLKEFVKAMAKPCIGCQRSLLAFGIKNVIFSNELGEVETL